MLGIFRDFFKRLKSVIKIIKSMKAIPSESYDFDHANNEENKFPSNEKVDFPVVWISELYTPSSSKSLLKGISAIGWDDISNTSFSINDWMNDVRAGHSSGKLCLGEIFPDNSLITSAGERKSSVPEGVVSISLCYLL
ncbi:MULTISPECIES: hypothetical protein [unclassified Cobetia]|uniref:hypothetical protein n=1 Tax=unclassified Cobetia TaxID=2609414 RepID=UPI00178C9DC4|nr:MULTISPECIES: hypothetical protein [unclassified Cobetia]MBE2167143.1 hypothetical protein [Cobetia sp. 2AS1]MDH2447412.1 hypothetical protein [Cobetia sp. 2AS]